MNNNKLLNDYGVLMSDVCVTADPEFDVDNVHVESVTYWLAALMYDSNGALLVVKKSDFDEDNNKHGFATKLPVYGVSKSGDVNALDYKSNLAFDLYNLIDAKVNKERGISYKVSDGIINWFNKHGDLRASIYIAESQIDHVDSTAVSLEQANRIVRENYSKFDNSNNMPSVLNTGIGYKFITLNKLNKLGLLK